MLVWTRIIMSDVTLHLKYGVSDFRKRLMLLSTALVVGVVSAIYGLSNSIKMLFNGYVVIITHIYVTII